MSCPGRGGHLLRPPRPSCLKTHAQTHTFPYFWQKVDVCAWVLSRGGAWVLCGGGSMRAACAARDPLRRVPRLARCAGKRLRVSPAPRPAGFESPALGPNQKTAPLPEPFQIQWWAMRDSACGCAARDPLRRVPRLARCAGKRLRASPAPRPFGFESPAPGPNQKNSPVAGAVSNSMVGDEGFEPPALCV